MGEAVFTKVCVERGVCHRVEIDGRPSYLILALANGHWVVTDLDERLWSRQSFPTPDAALRILRRLSPLPAPPGGGDE